MKLPLKIFLIASLTASPVSAFAETYENHSLAPNSTGIHMSGMELPPYLQCVPYAREVSGIQIYGDAHTWWDQAEGKFKRGKRPKVGAVGLPAAQKHAIGPCRGGEQSDR